MHPTLLNDVICDRQSNPCTVLLRQILLYATGTNRPHNLELLPYAIDPSELKPVPPILADHIGPHTLIGLRYVAFQITHHTLRPCLLRHGPVKCLVPTRVIGRVTFPAIPRFKISGIGPPRSDQLVLRRYRPEDSCERGKGD